MAEGAASPPESVRRRRAPLRSFPCGSSEGSRAEQPRPGGMKVPWKWRGWGCWGCWDGVLCLGSVLGCALLQAVLVNKGKGQKLLVSASKVYGGVV